MKLIEGKTIAQALPARIDTNGTTWYAAGAGAMDGWTSQEQFADPSYFRSDAPDPINHEGDTMSELVQTENGVVQYARYSEFAHLPLPPFPEAVNVEMDGWQRYKVPSPTTGKLTAYTRVTTVAKSSADLYKLGRWKERTKVLAVLNLIDQAAADYDYAADLLSKLRIAMRDEFNDRKGGANSVIDLIDDTMGGAEAREYGGAVHDWIAELDMGRILLHQIPEMFQAPVVAYQDAMARAGLIPVPQWVERLVMNDQGRETIVGRLDGIAWCPADGQFYVIDRKTSKTLDFSALEFGIQLAGYGFATKMLSVDRSEWLEMPTVSTELAFIIHIPSDQPERSQVIPVNLVPGAESFINALDVREHRRSADKRLLGGTIPLPTKEALRYVEARQAIQNIYDAEEAQGVMEQYADVWDDDLSSFGEQCFNLLDTES